MDQCFSCLEGTAARQSDAVLVLIADALEAKLTQFNEMFAQIQPAFVPVPQDGVVADASD